ncbi:heavy-metal-associated domain-containing protein [Deinococcus sp. HMF7620]|uniref:Heavy-metal-associated domain-containing protein n=1 Tax=Deinococcus arboris TaxID=2682977 RepID=A0A7C9M2T1_9DEIO|nr:MULTISPECIES: heavy-metal-associated domain-containing protein [Deinococcus]MBZ9751991.1 heavy-metal-associated domain-containing protein [Deinococcus betulae]MVN87802.1 heavy-metal-associated domain-containing protein [Deinococcus arboris]
MTGMTPKATRVLLGVRGMSRDAGTTVSQALAALPGVVKATPDEGQIEVHYDPSQLTVMDLVRAVRRQGFLAGML